MAYYLDWVSFGKVLLLAYKMLEAESWPVSSELCFAYTCTAGRRGYNNAPEEHPTGDGGVLISNTRQNNNNNGIY